VLGFKVLDEIAMAFSNGTVCLFEPYTPSDFEREQHALDQLGL